LALIREEAVDLVEHLPQRGRARLKRQRLRIGQRPRRDGDEIEIACAQQVE